MNVRVREASLVDIPFVRNLAVASVKWSIPSTRNVEPRFVKERTRRRLSELELTLHLQENFKIFVAEDVDNAELVGYIMLDLAHEEPYSGEIECMIQDLAIRQDCWGRHVASLLVGAAVEITAARGLKYVVAEVAAHNERSLLAATRGLGFEIERYQIVRRLAT